MDRQRVRPSLRDLADDYEQLAFPELEEGAKPAVSVTRARPPTILSTSTPPPIPIIPTPPKAAQEEEAPASAAPKPKAKSRFALQREREAAERAAAEAAAAASRGTERFELDLDGDQEAPSNASNMPKLVGEVYERSSAAPPLPPSAPGPSTPSPLAERQAATGFPASSHLMFPRKPSAPPVASPAAPFHADSPPLADPQSVPGLLASVSAENDNVLRRMTEAEILEEQRQIRESMGLSEGILRMLEARGRKKVEEQQQPAAPKRRPAPEGAPVAPSRKEKEKEVAQEDEEEGSPEYIRRHFFPDEPSNPNLDWMKAPPTTSAATSDSPSAHAFDLQGVLLPASAQDVAPAASTSHHVSSSTNFTIPSLLSLASSSVPSQRSTSLLVLGRILSHAEANSEALGAKVWSQHRLDAAQKAGYGLRDSNAGAASASITLLADLFAAEVASPTPTVSLAPGAELPPTILSSFLSSTPLPPLSQHLASATLPPSSLSQILTLLTSILELATTHTATKSTEIELFVSTPNLLEAVSKRFVARSWPPSSPSSSADHSTSAPSPSALTFLANLARSSRDTAKAIFDRKLAEPPLRFLSIPPWELEGEERRLGYQLVAVTFELWEVLGRYGIGTSMRTKGASVLDAVQERVRSYFVGERTALEKEEIDLVERWFSLLTIWTTAAVNPHVTEHDILWTHVEDWGQSAMDASRWALRQEGGAGRGAVLTKAWELLGAWLEGSKVNQSWRGEKQREWVTESLGAEFEQGGTAMVAVRAALHRLSSASTTPRDIDQDASLVLSALQLSAAYEEEANPPTPALFTLESSIVDPVFANLQAASSWRASSLLVALLPSLADPSTRLTRTLQVILRLRAGDEVAARDLVDWVVKAASTSSSTPLLTSLDAKLELPALQAASLLRPFFTFAIVTASGGRVVGPLHPRSRDLKLTASLHPFARREPLLAEDWPLVALNELLRSASSPVFKQLPQGWDQTELEILRSSLALMRLVSEAGPSVRAPLLVYDLIKVFMLEKDNTTSGTAGDESDLFRDDGVQASMEALLEPLLVASQGPQRLLADTRTSAETIEGVSSLISSAPFYQLYTDLVGLYDSISLSHPLFGLVLLPSLAMSYPVDYRKLLWIDYSHLLRMLRFPVDQVIVDRMGEGALASYLSPRERNESLLGAYGDALVSRKVDSGTGFLELLAVHHVSAALFDEEGSEPMAKKLAGAIVGQGSEEVVRRMLAYEQAQEEGDELKSGEACWSSKGAAWEARKLRLRVLVGEVGTKKLAEWGL